MTNKICAAGNGMVCCSCATALKQTLQMCPQWKWLEVRLVIRREKYKPCWTQSSNKTEEAASALCWTTLLLLPCVSKVKRRPSSCVHLTASFSGNKIQGELFHSHSSQCSKYTSFKLKRIFCLRIHCATFASVSVRPRPPCNWETLSISRCSKKKQAGKI